MNPNKIFLKENNKATIRFQILGLSTPGLMIKMGLRLSSINEERPVPLMLHTHREIEQAWSNGNGQVIVNQVGQVESMKFAVSILEPNSRFVDAEVSINPDKIEHLVSVMLQNKDDGTVVEDAAIFPRILIRPYGVNEVDMSDILGLDLVYHVVQHVNEETDREARERHLDYLARKK